MPIMHCPGCGTHMSDSHLRCPKCRRFNPRLRVDLVGFAGGVVAVFGLLAYIVTR